MQAHGTLIAAFLTRNNIFLASDGRVIDADRSAVHNEWSKVHRINQHVALLTAGTYIPHLRDDIARNCQERNIIAVDAVAQITSLILQEIWQRNAGRFEEQGSLDRFKVFVFLAGFDAEGRTRLFYSDSGSHPRFATQERPLFAQGRDLEIGAISTGSGQEENPSELLTNAIQRELAYGHSRGDLTYTLYSAFTSVKEQLSISNPAIGGKTFFSQVDWRNGYEDISERMLAVRR